MNRSMERRRARRRDLRALAVALIAALSAGCGGSEPEPLFPARYESDGSQVVLPLPVASAYQHCPNGAILFRQGAAEWVGTASRAAVLDWDTGVSVDLPLPDASGLHQYAFSQSPDCQTVVLSKDDRLYFAEVATGALTAWTYGSLPDYAPDGAQVAFVRDESIILKRIADDTEVQLEAPELGLSDRGVLVSSLTWGPTATILAVVTAQYDAIPTSYALTLVTLGADGASQTTIAEIAARMSRPAFAPDGAYLAYIAEPLDVPRFSRLGVLTFYSVRDSCVVARRAIGAEEAVFWSGDGLRLLTTGGRSDAEAFHNPYDGLPEIGAADVCLDAPAR